MNAFRNFAAALTTAFVLALAASEAIAGDELTARTRAAVTEASAEAVPGHFFDRERGVSIAAALREHAATDAFSGADFVDRHTQALGAFLSEYDKHFSTRWSDPNAESAAPTSRQRDGQWLHLACFSASSGPMSLSGSAACSDFQTN